MRKILLALMVIACSASASMAQKTFQGTIEYDIQIGGGDQAAMLSSMMFNKMVLKIGEKQMMTYFEGGMMSGMMGKIVGGADGKSAYIIRDSEGTVYVMDEADLDEEGVDNMTGMEVTKENEQVEIHGYRCEKYKIVTTVEDETTIQHIWTTTDLNMPNKNAKLGMGNMFNDEIKGFPLKFITESNAGGMAMTITMEASVLKEEKIDKDFFAYPEGYEVKDYDPKTFGAGGF
jgi:hypothetical protein